MSVFRKFISDLRAFRWVIFHSQAPPLAMRSERKITLEREAFHIRALALHIRREASTFYSPHRNIPSTESPINSKALSTTVAARLRMSFGRE